MNFALLPTGTSIGRRRFLQGLAGALPLLGGSVLQAAATPARRPSPELDLQYLARYLSVLPRSAWIREAPRTQRMGIAMYYDRLTIHHAGAEIIEQTQRGQVVRHLNGIHTAHVRRNYGDVGYHFMVDYAGRVWEGRSLAYQGAHVAGQNPGNLGIMLLGNFEKQRPAAAQVEALGKLLFLLTERFRIRRSAVYAHCDLAATDCPGAHLYRQLTTIRSPRS